MGNPIRVFMDNYYQKIMRVSNIKSPAQSSDFLSESPASGDGIGKCPYRPGMGGRVSFLQMRQVLHFLWQQGFKGCPKIKKRRPSGRRGSHLIFSEEERCFMLFLSDQL
jgi:hypothetical protein